MDYIENNKKTNSSEFDTITSSQSGSDISERVRALAALSTTLVAQLSPQATMTPWVEQLKEVAEAFEKFGGVLRVIAKNGPSAEAFRARTVLFSFDNQSTELSDKRNLNAKAAQYLLGLSKARVYQFAESGRIGARIDSSWRFSYSELRQFAKTLRPTGIHKEA